MKKKMRRHSLKARKAYTELCSYAMVYFDGAFELTDEETLHQLTYPLQQLFRNQLTPDQLDLLIEYTIQAKGEHSLQGDDAAVAKDKAILARLRRLKKEWE